MKSMYSYEKGRNALGVFHEFKGPGMPRYANSVQFMQTLNSWAAECLSKTDGEKIGDRDAETITHFLNAAFEAGKEEARREIRSALGVK